ncbi:MAG: ribosomal protein large subunit ribosomal protein [Candidatus Parcubacteria bacterium]|jgi:large subunit ribosomal protein L6
MSKIGKLPIQVKDSVSFLIENGVVTVKGGKGELAFSLPKGISVKKEEGTVTVMQDTEGSPLTRALFGLTRATLANMVEGVDVGFQKKLELVGVGYRAVVQGQDLVLSLGFSHPVKVAPPAGVTFSVAENIITIAGVDKMVIGDVAARIRKVRPPEPYKGKGIKYVGEHIRRKAGKAAKAVGGAK